MTPPKPDPNAVKSERAPCPFCGSFDILIRGTSPFWCECDNCEARGPMRSNLLECETEWNRRASPSVEEDLDSMPDWEKMYRDREAEAKLDRERADQLEDLYIAAQKEIESLRKKLEVCREALRVARREMQNQRYDKPRIGMEASCLTVDNALAQLSESKEEPVASRCPLCNFMYVKTDNGFVCPNDDCETDAENIPNNIPEAIESSEDEKDIDPMCLMNQELHVAFQDHLEKCSEERGTRMVRMMELQSQVEKLTKENETMSHNNVWLNKEYGYLDKELVRLRAEQTQLKEKLERYTYALRFIAFWGGAGIEGISCDGSWCAQQAKSSLDGDDYQSLSTHSQEQAPSSVMKAMCEASESARLEARKERSVAVDESYQLRAEQSQLKETLRSVYLAIDCSGQCRVHGNVSNSYCAPHRMINEALSTPPSQEQSKEVTAEMALEWLFGTMCTPYYREGKCVVLIDGIEYSGKTPLEALRSAMAKEKESK